MDIYSDDPGLASTVSERFCAPDADLIIRSSDGILFKVHRQNLAAHSEAFFSASLISSTSTDESGPTEAATSKGISQEDIVEFTEDSKTLDLLLQFMYRQRQPNITNLKYSQLMALAEAAEKYEVYAAMGTCVAVFESKFIDSNSLGIFKFARKHGYPNLVDKTAPRVLHRSEDLQKSALVDLRLRWHTYFDRCVPIVWKEFIDLLDSSPCSCRSWPKTETLILRVVGGKPHALMNRACLDDKSLQTTPACCTKALANIRTALKKKLLADATLPTFSSINDDYSF
ncbi:hypothetical protein HGRIS_000422 [Hohenbuehelia grisea]|uniref:BTB domain-containing protein n=1 Tax=Hohenbuehelia grisea TaxID=104357 RepID=A0ABR3JSW1_9AGAR